MTKFTDNLWSDLQTEHGAPLAQASAPEPGLAHRRRPRLLAGGSLGLAGIGAAAVLTLGGTASPAFAVTRDSDGSVTVTLNQASGIIGANQKLASMGIDERITVDMANGPATISGAFACTPDAAVGGPTIKVLNGHDGTLVIPSGNTATGTYHVASCTTETPKAYASGNSGPGSDGNSGSGADQPGQVAVAIGAPSTTVTSNSGG